MAPYVTEPASVHLLCATVHNIKYCLSSRNTQSAQLHTQILSGEYSEHSLFTAALTNMHSACTVILLHVLCVVDCELTHVQDWRGARPTVQVTDESQRIPLGVLLTVIHTRHTQTHSNSLRKHHSQHHTALKPL